MRSMVEYTLAKFIVWKGSIAAKPVMLHTTIMMPMAPPCNTFFPSTHASACTAIIGANNGKEYSSLDV